MRDAALSERQTQILNLIARGNSLVQVAVELDISMSTMRTHLGRIRERTGVKRGSRGALLIWAIKHGFPMNGNGHN